MATLPTLFPTSDQADGGWTDEAGGTTDLFGKIDETGTGTDYIRGQQDAATTVGQFGLTTMPADFSTMTSIDVEIRHSRGGVEGGDDGGGDDTHTLFARIVDSGGSALTDEMTIETGIVGYLVKTETVSFTTVVASDKTTWDGAELELRTTYTKDKGSDGDRTWVDFARIINGVYIPVFSVEQKQFRFKQDVGGETDGRWAAAEDTDISWQDEESPVRLRILLENDGADLPSTTDWKLQQNRNSTSWIDVPNTGTILRIFNSEHLADGDATTQQVGSGTFSAGEIAETDTFISNVGLTANEETELVWNVYVRISANQGDTFDFRVQYDAGAGYVTADTLTVTPRITVEESSSEMDQESFRWRDDDGTETGATWRQLKNVNDTHDGSTSSKIRLRFSLQSDGGGGHVTWDLTVSKNGGAYAGLLGESDWQGTTSTHVSDGDPTTQQLESGNFSEGIIDDNGLIGWTNNPTPSRSEIETILVPEQTLTDTDFYDFRWTHDLNVFDTYTQTARITISAGGPAVYPPFLHRPPRHVRM